MVTSVVTYMKTVKRNATDEEWEVMKDPWMQIKGDFAMSSKSHSESKWANLQDASRNEYQYFYERLLIQQFLLNADDLNIPF